MPKRYSLDPSRQHPLGGEANTLALVHGLSSNRVRGRVEREIGESLRRAMTTSLANVYDVALDEHAIRRAARALAVVEIVEAQIDLVGVDEISDRMFALYQRASVQADRWLERLGMTPSARAKLGVNVAKTFGLIEEMDRRRQEQQR